MRGGAICTIDDDRFADKILMPGFVEGHAHMMEGSSGVSPIWAITTAWPRLSFQASVCHTFLDRMSATRPVVVLPKALNALVDDLNRQGIQLHIHGDGASLAAIEAL